MSAKTDQPFLQASPDDDGLKSLNSIESWPSLVLKSGNSDQLIMYTPEQLLKTFCAMPARVQREFTDYPLTVKQALQRYAETSDPHDTVNGLVGAVPDMLFRNDQNGYIPIEVAFEAGNGAAARLMLKVAKCSLLLEKLLSYRNLRFGHTLLMLAVHLNNKEHSDIFLQLMSHDASGLHRCYDSDGKNVFHRCTELEFSVSFQIIFGLLIEHRDSLVGCSPLDIKGALEMTDSTRNTPLHYIAASGKVEMFQALKTFWIRMNLVIDFDACFKCSSSVTPLIVAVQKGHFEICEWLLENGSIDVHFKQHSTCLTALHFAVRAGNPELIALLMRHRADPQFWDDECAQLDGYKTPLEMAQANNFPNKQACIGCLKQGY